MLSSAASYDSWLEAAASRRRKALKCMVTYAYAKLKHSIKGNALLHRNVTMHWWLLLFLCFVFSRQAALIKASEKMFFKCCFVYPHVSPNFPLHFGCICYTAHQRHKNSYHWYLCTGREDKCHIKEQRITSSISFCTGGTIEGQREVI